MQPEVLSEDEYLMALNKPSGMVVNRGFSTDETLQEYIDKNFDFPLAHNAELRNGIVHRLDKETSGVILVAKTREILEELQRQLKEREVEKVYLGLVHGEVREKEGIIEAPIGRMPRNRRRFGVVPGGREATTEYKVTQLLSDAVTQEKLSLVEFHPKTGRTHQIRVHAKHIGHPVVSDPVYAGRKTNRRDRKWCSRLFLHAASIVFKHPISGEKIRVEAELPEDLRVVLKNLE